MADEEKDALVSVKDLAGVSAPLTKLAETVGAVIGRTMDGAGRVIHAYLLASKEARNEAERITLVEGAKTQSMTQRAQAFAALSSGQPPQMQTLDINSDGTVTAQLSGIPAEVQSINKRAEQRLIYQNVVEQLNIESVLNVAAEELVNEGQVAEEPVKPDWSKRFFNIAQDVSEEDGQILLGKILAGEVKKPGSFSLRTLEVLRNLTQEEAVLFTNLCQYVGQMKGNLLVFRRLQNQLNEVINNFFSYKDVIAMVDCGLLQGTEQSALTYTGIAGELEHIIPLSIGKHVMIARKPGDVPLQISISRYTLTNAAIELSTLVKVETPMDYFMAVARQFIQSGFTVQYAQLVEWAGGGNGIVIVPPAINID